MYNSHLLLLGKALLFSLPIIFFSKWLEQEMKPKEGCKNFSTWILAVVITSILWFSIVMYCYTKFFFPNR